MLKVKIKYINPAKLVRVGKFGKKYATVGATTLVDVDTLLKDVGVVTMGYKADGATFLASIAFCPQLNYAATLLFGSTTQRVNA